MRIKKSLFALFILLTVKSFSQVIDTVYFDLDGKIIIKEVAAYCRIANFDTTTGKIIGEFKDYYNPKDSLIASGQVSYTSKDKLIINDFIGDEEYLQIAKNMCELRASYIRISDYPLLKKVIKPRETNEGRITHGDFIAVEELPSFPGGMEALAWFIGQFIIYPEEARKHNISGTVKVKFTIDTDGSIKNISIISGIGYGCDEEAIRIMGLMPDWLPGLQRGKPVKVNYSLPISFK